MTFVWEIVNFWGSHNIAGAPELRTLRWTGYVVRIGTDFLAGKTFGQQTTARVRERLLLPLPLFFLLLPLALQPAVGFGLSNNVPPFCPICHQLFPSSHSQHLKISFYFFSPSFLGHFPSFRPSQFLSEGLFGHAILLHSLQVTQPTYPLPLYPFYYSQGETEG